MDWIQPLAAQQLDLIARLKLEVAVLHHLTDANLRGYHSELTVISDSELDNLKKACWDIVERSGRNNRLEAFINQLQRQLANLAVKKYLDTLIQEVEDADEPVAGTGTFTLSSDPTVSILVKASHTKKIDTAKWRICQADVDKNLIFVASWIQEEVSEEQAEYHIIMAGFMPTYMIDVSEGEASLKMADLLYSGGLRIYIETLQPERLTAAKLMAAQGVSEEKSGDILELPVKPLTSVISQPWKLAYTVAGHWAGIEAIALDNYEKTLVSAGEDKTIRIWNIETNQLIRTIEGGYPDGHTRTIFAVAINRDRETIATGSEDKTVKLWDIRTGQLLVTFTGHNGAVYSLAFSPDGKTLFSGSVDGHIKVWSVGDSRRTLKNTITAHARVVYALAVNPHSGVDSFIPAWAIAEAELSEDEEVESQTSLLASASADQTIKIWNIKTGELVQTLSGHTGSVYSLAFHSRHSLLASGSVDKTVKVWNLKTGRCIHTIEDHPDWVHSVAFVEHTLVSGCGDGTIKEWYLTNKNLQGRGKPAFTRNLTGHTGKVKGVILQGNYGYSLISASSDSTIKLWTLSDGKLNFSLGGTPQYAEDVAITPDGKSLIVIGDDKNIKLWDLATGSLRQILTGHKKGVRALACSPDGQTMVSGSWDKTIKVWDLATGQVKSTLFKTEEAINSIAVSPNGKIMAVGIKNYIQLRDLATGDLLHTLSGHDKHVTCLAFSPDGLTIATGSYDNTAKLWQVETGSLIRSLNMPVLTEYSPSVDALAFSPDGRTLAIGGDNFLQLWHLRTDEFETVLDRVGVNSIAFSSNGQMQAIGIERGEVLLRHLPTKKVIQCLLMDSHEMVVGLAFTPDGNALACCSRHMVKVWQRG